VLALRCCFISDALLQQQSNLAQLPGLLLLA
jgi:hypothetical protein